MTHEQAIARCAELNAEPDRQLEWFPKQVSPDEWTTVSVAIPGMRRIEPLKAAIESKPRPSEPPDPRPAIFRNIPPYGPG
jgi:hypothetical protein